MAVLDIGTCVRQTPTLVLDSTSVSFIADEINPVSTPVGAALYNNDMWVALATAGVWGVEA